jgi:transposase
MRVKLSKLDLPEEAAIEALDHDELIALAKLWRHKISEYQSILFRVRRRLFGPKSERSGHSDSSSHDDPAPPKPRGETKKRLSERYPDAPIREDRRDFEQPPTCGACGCSMSDSGMTEDSEYLDVQTREFTVVQQKRHKHRCHKCHGSIVTTPVPPRVTPGGSYSDYLIIDATLSKYCDLIPMERYCQMAARSGLHGLPPHSLIKASFALAEYLQDVYILIKNETLATAVLLADETPHRMLEGDAKKRWYLWGFSNSYAAFFECHDTRSGDVSTNVLVQSTCQVLLSDAYSGYKKSINVANEIRASQGLPPIAAAYCNAHARRQFYSGTKDDTPSIDAEFIVKKYDEIYRLNDESKILSDECSIGVNLTQGVVAI